jgi:hypothetical protein
MPLQGLNPATFGTPAHCSSHSAQCRKTHTHTQMLENKKEKKAGFVLANQTCIFLPHDIFFFQLTHTLLVSGNDFMKAEKFSDAMESYTKAIKLDGKNAIYYCNRSVLFLSQRMEYVCKKKNNKKK